MTPHANPAAPARARLCLLAVSAALPALVGCASQGTLQPPSLHLAAPVQHLAAERFGDAVEVTWTTPTRTTDGVSLTSGRHSKGPFTAEICRAPAAIPPGPCRPLASVPAEPGKPGSFHDALSSPLSSGAPGLLHYRVRILNGKGRGATGIETAVIAGTALPPLVNLTAAPSVSGGVTLRWQPVSTMPGDHILLRVTRGTADHAETLAMEPADSTIAGTNDAGARPGLKQSYSVFRTRTITLDRQTLTLNSAPAAVTVEADALPPPPSAPIGLDAVVNTLGAPEIDLVWQAADEPGVIGYVVYRSQAGAAFTAVTPHPIRAFSYSDTDVRRGERYRYRVAAINANGVAGAVSASIERTIPAQ